jgi:hypothetical protein
VKDLKGGKTVGGRTRVGLPTRVGLAGVQARALSEVGSGSRIRYGPGRVRQVKVKSLSEGGRVSWIRLARLSGSVGLSWGRAKPLTRIGLSLIHYLKSG